MRVILGDCALFWVGVRVGGGYVGGRELGVMGCGGRSRERGKWTGEVRVGAMRRKREK